MDHPWLVTLVCERCRGVLDADDNYCRRCGTPTAHVAGLSSDGLRSMPHGEKKSKAWENPWVVLSLLFFVLGPFALPLLWRSSRFSPLWKNVLTVLVLALTVFLIWALWFIIHLAIGTLPELLKVLR